MALLALCFGLLVPLGLSWPKESLAAASVSESAAQRTSQENAPAEVQSFAKGLIQSLSAQEAFASWRGSVASYDPLGPGTHAWLVSLAAGGKPVGYLIIAARPGGGLALAEYGAGPDPLYDPGRLTIEPGGKLEPLYGGPTLTQWRIVPPEDQSAAYLEASTGEALPDTDADWSKRSFGSSFFYHAVSSDAPEQPQPPVVTSAFFEPYDNLLWMTHKPLTAAINRLPNVLQTRKKLVFSSSGPARTYSQALPVTGYQQWTLSPKTAAPGASGALYIRSGTKESPRYILFDALAASGSFTDWTGK